MGPKITIRQPLPADVPVMVKTMRRGDYNEIRAMFGPDVEASVHKAVCTSSRAFSGEVDGVLTGMFGVAPMAALSGIGSPWMIGTPLLEEFPKLICKYGRALVDITQIEYTELRNYVDVRNTTSIEWLRWLGFTIHPPEIIGYEKRLFHKFDLIRPRMRDTAL